MSAREWVPRGTVSGPTRRSAPTDSIEMSITPKTTGGDRARPLQKDGEYAEGWGDNRPMPVRDLLGFRRPRLPQGTMPGMTAGIPPPAFVPRPNVPRKARSKAPAPVSPKSSVTSRKVSKGRAAALPLAVGGVWGRNRNAPRIFLRDCQGGFFSFEKNPP